MLRSSFDALSLFALLISAKRLRGYHWDDHLQLYHVRHRVYDPTDSPGGRRWLQRDPAFFVDGLNLYAYCGGDPVNGMDPLGLWKWDGDWVESALRAAAGAVGLGGATNAAAASGFAEGAEEGRDQIAASTAQLVTAFGHVPWLPGADDLHEMAREQREKNGWTHSIAYGAGYVANGAAVAAVGLVAFELAGGSTMHVTLGKVANQSVPHIMFGSGGTTVHGMGSLFGGEVVVTTIGVSTVTPVVTVSGIPVLFGSQVVLETTVAGTCATAAWEAFKRGWGR